LGLQASDLDNFNGKIRILNNRDLFCSRFLQLSVGIYWKFEVPVRNLQILIPPIF